MQSFEFHFQEGFTGQVVEIVSDGRVLERLTLRTRFQIGLADIARAELAPGDRVTLRMREPPLETHVVLDAATPYVAVTFTGESLLVTATAGTPGYV